LAEDALPMIKAVLWVSMITRSLSISMIFCPGCFNRSYDYASDTITSQSPNITFKELLLFSWQNLTFTRKEYNRRSAIYLQMYFQRFFWMEKHGYKGLYIWYQYSFRITFILTTTKNQILSKDNWIIIFSYNRL
jgi:hypothetical protein